MNKHIFKANRGEGKTTWLIDRVVDSVASCHQIYYMGSKKCFLKFRDKCWEAGVTGVHHMSECIPSSTFDVFTDEFMAAFSNISKDDLAFATEYADNWYITMSAEDFEEKTK